MAKDVQDTVREFIGRLAEDATKGVDAGRENLSSDHLSGMKGIAAGAGAAVLMPLAAKGLGKVARSLGSGDIGASPGRAMQGVTSKVGDTLTGAVGDKLSDKFDDMGGPAGLLKGAVKNAMPFGGDDDDDDGSTKDGPPGAGKGRRMPVQQSIDIGAPIETVYNQWTQFELWPNFMHRVTRASQEDDCTVSFSAKIWGKTKDFKAHIETQRPNERIKWRVSEGMNHAGVVTFHELGPNLTRVLLGLDVQPGSMLEKAARGLRHVKRAARGDLHRFKAFVEMQGQETGAWRGTIEHGKLVKKHARGYDRQHEYAEAGDFFPDAANGDDPEKKAGSGRSGQRRSGQSQRAQGRSSTRSSNGTSGSGSRSASSGRASGSSASSRSGSSGRGGSSGRSSSGGGSASSRRASSGRSGSSSRASAGNHSEGRSRSRGRG